jgi:hypothetical protein
MRADESAVLQLPREQVARCEGKSKRRDVIAERVVRDYCLLDHIGARRLHNSTCEARWSPCWRRSADGKWPLRRAYRSCPGASKARGRGKSLYPQSPARAGPDRRRQTQ